MSFRSKAHAAEERREREKARAKRAALRALKKARKAAEQTGTKLSDWEGEFLGSVEERVEGYVRAFGDLGVVNDVYEIGEIQPLGHVPKSMYAWAIRKDRHGPPEESMQIELVPTWPLDSH